MISKIFFIPLALLVFFLAATDAWGQLLLEAPERVAKGDAFLARGSSSEPVNDFVFTWRGKSHLVKARREDGQRPVWRAEILLPAPLDEKAGHLNLALGAGGADKTRAVPSVRADIALYERKRPVQKLTVDKKYVNPPASEKERIKRDRQKVGAVLANYLPERMWAMPFERPVPGSVSSQFGLKRVFNGEPRSVHRGLDLRGASGSPIKACADGEVVLVDNLYYSGNAVYVNHGEGVFTAYLHMSEPKVKVGQKVKKGDLIGLVGATGRVTGPHLHLSLIVQGQSVDPQSVLEERKINVKH